MPKKLPDNFVGLFQNNESSILLHANASVERRNMDNEKHNALQVIISQALEEMKKEQESRFDLEKVNLAELGRRTGLSRKKVHRRVGDGAGWRELTGSFSA